MNTKENDGHDSEDNNINDQEKIAQDIREQLAQAEAVIVDYVKKNPLKTIGIALMVGIAAGKWFHSPK